MATPLCRSWKSLEVDGRLQIPRHLETQGGLSSIAFKSSRFFSPNFVETRKGNGFAQLCRRHFVCSFGSEERRAAALEPQMATPGFKDLQFSCQKIQCAAIMARSAGTSKNPVGYCLLASDATYIYIYIILQEPRAWIWPGQAPLFAQYAMHNVGSGGRETR